MRKQNEIIRLANVIKNEAQTLDDNDGDENSIEEGFEISRQLYIAAGGGDGNYDHPDVIAWMNGEQSGLDDYLA